MSGGGAWRTLGIVQTERLGRFGPRLSTVGVRWRAELDRDGAGLWRAGAVGVNWVLLEAGEASAVDHLAVPPGWTTVLIASDAGEAHGALRVLGRSAVDVVLAAEASSWRSAVALVDRGLAHCAGLVTDSAGVVERSRRHRHVDAVLTSVRPDPALVRVCRWSGTGVLVGTGRIAVHHPGPTVVASATAD